ncbi:hypothetical protein SCYAM73S_02033 [Streptomyces cyaneofuscatus]
MSSAEPTEQTGPAVRSHPDHAQRPEHAQRPAPAPGLAESARRLADSTTTSTALVADALARIEAAQPTLNAFRHLRADAALAEAADATEKSAVIGRGRLARGIELAGDGTAPPPVLRESVPVPKRRRSATRPAVARRPRCASSSPAQVARANGRRACCSPCTSRPP